MTAKLNDAQPCKGKQLTREAQMTVKPNDNE